MIHLPIARCLGCGVRFYGYANIESARRSSWMHFKGCSSKCDNRVLVDD